MRTQRLHLAITQPGQEFGQRVLKLHNTRGEADSIAQKPPDNEARLGLKFVHTQYSPAGRSKVTRNSASETDLMV